MPWWMAHHPVRAPPVLPPRPPAGSLWPVASCRRSCSGWRSWRKTRPCQKLSLGPVGSHEVCLQENTLRSLEWEVHPGAPRACVLLELSRGAWWRRQTPGRLGCRVCCASCARAHQWRCRGAKRRRPRCACDPSLRSDPPLASPGGRWGGRACAGWFSEMAAPRRLVFFGVLSAPTAPTEPLMLLPPDSVLVGVHLEKKSWGLMKWDRGK